jgi:hypothetical protein
LQIGLDKNDHDKAFIQLTLEFVTKQVRLSKVESLLFNAIQLTYIVLLLYFNCCLNLNKFTISWLSMHIYTYLRKVIGQSDLFIMYFNSSLCVHNKQVSPFLLRTHMTVVYVFNIYCKTPLHAVMCLPTQFRGYAPKILEANAYACICILVFFLEHWCLHHLKKTGILISVRSRICNTISIKSHTHVNVCQSAPTIICSFC